MSATFSLGIEDLKLIRDILQDCHYDETKWHDVGLSLNLSLTDLNAIRVKCSNDPHECLKECLSVWLCSPGRSVHLLANALEDNNGYDAANAIRDIMLAPASQIMLSHSKEFSRVILNDDLVTLLLTEVIISSDMQKTIKRRRYSLDGPPFRAICRTVANEQEKLKLLADALKRHVETFPLGTKLLEDYCRRFPETLPTETSVQFTAINPQLSAKEILMNKTYESLFDAMRGKFGILRRKIIPILSNKISFEELKLFLIQCYSELKVELAGVESIDDAMTVVEKHSNIINVAKIETIVDCYNVTEAKKLVTEYKEEIEKFSSDMKLHLMFNKNLSTHCSSLACETIKFVLDWEPSDHSLEDIRLLLEKAFGDLGRRVLVRRIGKANSILIICYAPLYLMNDLLMKAQTNLPVLQEKMLLMQLHIGHYCVYDRDLINEESEIAKNTTKDVQKVKDSLMREIMELKTTVLELRESLVKAHSKNQIFIAVQLPTFQEIDELFEFVKVHKFNIPVIEKCSHTKTQFSDEIEKDLMLLAALRQMKKGDKETTSLVDHGDDWIWIQSPTMKLCDDIPIANRHEQIDLKGISPDILLLLLPAAMKAARKITIQCTPLPQDCIHSLADFLADPTVSIKTLQICDSSINDQGVITLCSDALRQNNSISELTLSNNPDITSKSSVALSHLLRNNSNLSVLSLQGTSLTSDGIRQILTALADNTSLKKLWLDLEHKEIYQEHYSAVENRVEFVGFHFDK